MPNISSLTMPDGIVYAIKDSQARKDIEDIKKNSSGSGESSSSGSGLFVVGATLDGTTLTLNKTAREIVNAMKTTGAVFVYGEGEQFMVCPFGIANSTSQGTYQLIFGSFTTTCAADEYPVVNL